MKKEILKFILKINIIIVLLTFFGGCALNDKPESDKLSVVTVNFAQYDFARAVCGDMADVKMIVRPGAEVHGYEPSLADIISIEEADVFIYGGGESDVWIEKILESTDTQGKKIIPLMQCEGITLYEEEIHTEAHSHGEPHHAHSHGDSYDEHIWTSPKNAIKIVEIICDEMIKTDSKNSAYYEKNAIDYIAKLQKTDTELMDIVRNSDSRFIAVADRFPFLYLAKDYGIDYIAAFSGCSPESDAGPSVIAHMIDEINYHSTGSVFYIELSNQKMADAICEHTGVKKLQLHSCQSISKLDFEKGITYADIMEENVNNLKEVLI